MSEEPKHDGRVDHEHVHSSFCRFRARCSCGWSSDNYSQARGAERALEVHLSTCAMRAVHG